MTWNLKTQTMGHAFTASVVDTLYIAQSTQSIHSSLKNCLFLTFFFRTSPTLSTLSLPDIWQGDKIQVPETREEGE